MKYLTIIILICSSLFLPAQDLVSYYVEINGVLTKYDGDPSKLNNIIYWKIRLNKTDNTKWGCILGDTYQSTMDQLIRNQNTQREYENLLNTRQDLTYFNYLGPIAVAKSSAIKGANREFNSVNRIISLAYRLNTLYEHYSAAKNAYNIYLEKYPEALNHYKDIGNVLKEYSFLLQNNQFRMDKIADKLDNQFNLSLEDINKTIDQFSNSIDNQASKISEFNIKLERLTGKEIKESYVQMLDNGSEVVNWKITLRDISFSYHAKIETTEDTENKLFIQDWECPISNVKAVFKTKRVDGYFTITLQLKSEIQIYSTDDNQNNSELSNELLLHFSDEGNRNRIYTQLSAVLKK